MAKAQWPAPAVIFFWRTDLLSFCYLLFTLMPSCFITTHLCRIHLCPHPRLHLVLLPLASVSSSPWLSYFFWSSFHWYRQLVGIPTLEEEHSRHSSQIPTANSQSPSVTQKGAQQTSFQLPASKHPQEYSLFLSIAPPLLPAHTKIT